MTTEPVTNASTPGRFAESLPLAAGPVNPAIPQWVALGRAAALWADSANPCLAFVGGRSVRTQQRAPGQTCKVAGGPGAEPA